MPKEFFTALGTGALNKVLHAVLVLVIGLLRAHIVDHAHGHPRQSLVRQPQLSAAQHELRPVGLSGCLSHFFAGVLVVR
mgnify:CR=1 FL=1